VDGALLENLENLAKILAIVLGGAWVFFNTIRGRTFIPRLQPTVSGKVVRHGGIQYLLVNFQVQNVGSSIAHIKERGTGLKIGAMQAFGGATEILDLNTEKQTAFPVFDMLEKETIAIEPGTTIYSQEMVEVPMDQYAGFRIELRVSAVRGSFLSKKDRKWRAWAVALDDSGTEKAQKEGQ
jgi:hypothetical protein